MQVRNIGEGKDIQMWASAMSNLVSQGAITVDDPTEQWIRKQMDMPLKLEPRPQMDAKTPGPTTDQGGIKGDTTGNVGKAPDEG
jgi:hypothetical protein